MSRFAGLDQPEAAGGRVLFGAVPIPLGEQASFQLDLVGVTARKPA